MAVRGETPVFAANEASLGSVRATPLEVAVLSYDHIDPVAPKAGAMELARPYRY
jgi:hypothetical protein